MLPSILFRYRSLSGEAFKHTQDIFLRERLYLSSAEALNDLGEGLCTMELPSHMQKNNRSQMETWAHGNYGWGMQIRHSQSKGKIRIASFSASCTNQLLWSHYADSHRGICIGFLMSATPDLSCASPVTYNDNLPVWRGDDKDLMSMVFCTKSTDWSYEQEWRVITESKTFLSLPKIAIHTVILGARISDADQAWVEDWMQLKAWNPIVQRATFADNRYEMRVQKV
jgi:Protein of unknown function (DUF2971)